MAEHPEIGEVKTIMIGPSDIGEALRNAHRPLHQLAGELLWGFDRVDEHGNPDPAELEDLYLEIEGAIYDRAVEWINRGAPLGQKEGINDG